MKGSVGVIFGETGSHSFRFAVTDPADVKRTDYVKVWHSTDGWVLGQVLSMTRSSEVDNFDNAIMSNTGRLNGADSDRTVASVTVIGARDQQGLLRTPMTPFRPGDKVYKAENELIVDALGLSQGGAYLGLLDGTDIPVTVDRNKLIQKHCSILAMTGSGKSYTTAVIIEEMMDREVPLLIIDPHGEYASLKEANDDVDIEMLADKFGIDPRGFKNVTIYTPANKKLCEYADRVLRLNGLNLPPKEIIEYVPSELNNTEIGLIYEAINDLFMKGQASIIDMKGIHPDVQQIIVARLLSNLFEARKANLVPPGMVVVEEAHNYCPEKGFMKTSSSDVLRTIASEGRKFGLGLLIVSQRPAKVDKNVLSQCNTQIIMRVTNPNDIRAITKSLEGISSELEEEIKRLPPGVALFVSPDIPRAVMLQVRVRKSKHGGSAKDIYDEAPLEEEEEIIEQVENKGQGGSLFRKLFGKR